VLFVTHLAVAVVLGRVSRLSPVWLVAGAALPDAIDKPLGMAGVFELYHSIGHSVILTAVFVPLALSSRSGRALAVGWGSHLLLDAFHVVLNGRSGHLLAFLWPFAASADPLAIPPGAFARYYVGTVSFYVEVGLWTLLIAGLIAGRFREQPLPWWP
jgi:hypothetical protein